MTIVFKYRKEHSAIADVIYRPVADVTLITREGRTIVPMYIYSGADIALKRVDISEDAILKEFSVFKNKEEVRYERLDEAKIFLVKKNVLFVDSTRRTMRPQSKLDLLAIRAVVEEET